MSNKKGLSAVALVLIGFVVLVIGAVAWVATSYISAANSGALMESNITMLNKNSENVLSAVTTNIKEQAGITGVYADDFRKSLEASMSGRYGPSGSQATMQWIKEQNPTLDSSIYAKVQTIIDGGRKEFQTSQTRKLEICRDYNARLNYVVSGAFLRFAGYPKLKLDDVCKVVSDSSSRNAFETGLNEPVSFERSKS